GELAVSARGELSVGIQPGCAIDGQGNELVVWDTVIKSVHPDQFKLPTTVYVVLRYTEELTDFISYKNNLAIKGHKRVLEGAQVDVQALLPSIGKEVEIARILLDTDAKALRDAKDAPDPKPKQAALRHVP